MVIPFGDPAAGLPIATWNLEHPRPSDIVHPRLAYGIDERFETRFVAPCVNPGAEFDDGLP